MSGGPRDVQISAVLNNTTTENTPLLFNDGPLESTAVTLPLPKPTDMNTTRTASRDNGDSTSEIISPLPKHDPPPFRKRFHQRLITEIDTKWGDIILIGCFFCSGLVDASAFNIYGCFVSMQTGNTIFAALGVSGLPANSPTFAWTKALMAIVCFIIGAFCFANFHRLLSPRKRWVLMASFGIQSVLIIVTASLVTAGVVSNKTMEAAERNKEQTQRISSDSFPLLDLLPIGLLAFQSSGQVVASRVLKYNGLPTVVLTSLYTDLMMDSHLLTAGLFDDPDRNRRAGAAISLFIGAVIGGVIAKSWLGFAGALWIAALIKALMVLAWVLWKPLPNQQALNN